MVLEIGRPIFSSETFSELETRLLRPKFDRYISSEHRQKIICDLSAFAEWVEIPSHLVTKTYCRDPDDDKFIQTALAAQVPWLVSGDRDLLDAPALPELRILTAIDALESLRIST
ncbi:putative toxin-antitoxin system toxin component, PIN family [Allochromatium warmingii]|uniref:putative toxin-antitoxin system toxin component, PIN family n=1 Tax=Allochromatium warmingii TaxID=61595 RepID=UPI0015A720B9|nr:putative toxin-antitoxin system toxin component, PIN family [Allochromatium warmingii]